MKKPTKFWRKQQNTAAGGGEGENGARAYAEK